MSHHREVVTSYLRDAPCSCNGAPPGASHGPFGTYHDTATFIYLKPVYRPVLSRRFFGQAGYEIAARLGSAVTASPLARAGLPASSRARERAYIYVCVYTSAYMYDQTASAGRNARWTR